MASQSLVPASTTPPPTKLTVLISGSGTNLQALIDATSTLLPSVSIVRVVSDRKHAYGLKRAEIAKIPILYHNLISGNYYNKGETDKETILRARERFDADLAKHVLADGPDLVVCAGFMHVLAPAFLEPLDKARVPVINLHPALPQAYDGTKAIERAWQDFQDGKLEGGYTGIMVHFVVAEVDRGEPIVIRKVQCRDGESLEALTERIHEEEHRIIVEGTGLAIARLWEDRRA